MFNILNKKSPDNIYISGDLNCQSYKFMMKLDMRNIKNSHIIILGNFGIGKLNKKIEEKNLQKINSKLLKNNNKLYLLKGNLDNDIIFKSYKNKYDNIYFSSNYDIITIEKLNFLFINDSVTIDRLLYFDHFRDNIKFFTSTDIPYKKVNIVLSNDNVNFIYPYNLNKIKIFSKYDKWLYNDFKKNRNNLANIYNVLKKDRKYNITHWFSSKYNINKIENKDNVNFVQLKKMEIKKL